MTPSQPSGWIGTASLLLLASCAEPGRSNLILSDIDEDITHLVFVVRAEDRIASVSPLIEQAQLPILTTGDWATPIEAESTVEVFGFRAADLGPLASMADSSQVMKPATLADPTLPKAAASWVAQVRDPSRVEPLSAAIPTPKLTASWMPKCETTFPEGSALDASCASTACNLVVTQDGCHLALDLVACLGNADARLAGTFDANGTFEIDADSYYSSCQSVPPRFGAQLEVECNNCRISAYTSLQSLGLEIEVRQIEPASQLYEDGFPHRPVGFVQDLALHQDLLITNFKQFGQGEEGFWRCAPEERLHAFSADSLEPVWTSTVPGCLGRFVVDTERNEILVGLQVSLDLLRYDMTGRLLERRELPAELPPDVEGRDPEPAGMAFVATEPRALAISLGGRPGVLLLLDADTLEVRHQMEFNSEGIRELIVIDDALYVLDDDTHELLWIDPIAGNVVRKLELRDVLEYKRGVSELYYHAPSDRILMNHALNGGGFFSADRALTSLRTAISTVGVTATPFDIIDWPHDDGQVLMGLMASNERRTAYLARVEVGAEASRFLPLLQEIGQGPLRRLVTGPEGDIFGVLTWTGQLVRIRP